MDANDNEQGNQIVEEQKDNDDAPPPQQQEDCIPNKRSDDACTEKEEELLNDIIRHRQQAAAAAEEDRAPAAEPNKDEQPSVFPAATVSKDGGQTTTTESELSIPEQESLSYVLSTSSLPGAFRIPGTRTSIRDRELASMGAIIHDTDEEEDDDDPVDDEVQDAERGIIPVEEEVVPSDPAPCPPELSTEGIQSMVVTATVHNHDEELAQVEEEVRRRILQESVEANVIAAAQSSSVAPPESSELPLPTKDVQQKTTNDPSPRKKFLLLFLFLAVVFAFVLGIVLGRKADIPSEEGEEEGETETVKEDDNPFLNVSLAIDTRPTLEKIRKRGAVRCGYAAIGGDPMITGVVDGFNIVHFDPETGMLEGFHIDQCRAMAIAVFGDPTKIQPIYTTPEDRFLLLANDSLDILTNPVTYLMNSDVYEGVSEVGFTFSAPYLHVGLAFAGVPDFVQCADNLDSFTEDCRYLRICVEMGTSYELFLNALLPGRVIVPFPNFGKLWQWFGDGTCNVIASDRITLIFLPQLIGYEGPYKIGRNNYSKEPVSLATRDDDAEWSNLVNMVVNLLFLAEAENITKANAEDVWNLLPPDGGGGYAELAPALVAIVAEFGNYGDFYEKHLESFFPRQEINSVYDRTQHSGLLYSFPFGDVGLSGPAPLPGSILESILTRGFFHCGVPQPPRVGFAEVSEDEVWSGLDIEFCRAISGALFAGSTENVVFVELPRNDTFSALTSGDVDVVTGARRTMLANYKEPITGRGYTFSSPYFYDNDQLGHAYALMVGEEDPQWSAFVFWVVVAIIHADEAGIVQNSSRKMPVTTLFGERMEHMLQDSVLAVGSYGEIYNRTLESHLQRSGANILYENSQGRLHIPISLY